MKICLYDISLLISIHLHCIYAGWILILLLNLFLGKLAISSDPPFLWFWESWEIWEMSKFWCRWGRGERRRGGDLESIEKCDLLPPYSAFCISYVTQLSNIFPMRRRHGIILKGQCSLDKCLRNNFHDILLQKFARVFHILALKLCRNFPATICALNSCICTSKSGVN